MCGRDGFPSYKGHILWVWVLPLSRKNLFFEALHWGRMLLAEIDSSLTAVRRLWLLRSGDAKTQSQFSDCTSKSIFNLIFTNNRLFSKRSVRLAQAERKPSLVRGEFGLDVVCLIVYINGRKQIPKGRPPEIISGENLGIARRQPTARVNVGLGRNSLNLGNLGYHIRDLRPTSLVNGKALGVFSFEKWQTISCTVSGFSYAPGAFVVFCLDAVP